MNHRESPLQMPIAWKPCSKTGPYQERDAPPIFQRVGYVIVHLGIWIGDGLPAIPKRVYDRMINWEFVDLAELKPAGVLESLHLEPDPQRYIILPGLEVARARKKPIEEIGQWIQGFQIVIQICAVCKYWHMCLQCWSRHSACHCQKGLRSAIQIAMRYITSVAILTAAVILICMPYLVSVVYVYCGLICLCLHEPGHLFWEHLGGWWNGEMNFRAGRYAPSTQIGWVWPTQ